MDNELENRIKERWGKASAGEGDINRRIVILHNEFKSRALRDVERVLRQTTIEYIARFRMKGKAHFSSGDMPDILADTNFYFGEALYAQRSAEARTGLRNLTTVNAYFAELGIRSLDKIAEPHEARAYIKRAEENRRDYLVAAQQMNAGIESRTDTPAAEWMAENTHQVLAVLLYHKRKDSGHYLGENATSLAHYYVIGGMSDEQLEQIIQQKARRFIETIPAADNINEFVKKIKQRAGEIPASYGQNTGNIVSLFGREI